MERIINKWRISRGHWTYLLEVFSHYRLLCLSCLLYCLEYLVVCLSDAPSWPLPCVDSRTLLETMTAPAFAHQTTKLLPSYHLPPPLSPAPQTALSYSHVRCAQFEWQIWERDGLSLGVSKLQSTGSCGLNRPLTYFHWWSRRRLRSALWCSRGYVGRRRWNRNIWTWARFRLTSLNACLSGYYPSLIDLKRYSFF